MLHFTCDLCGQPLREERFVARVEVYPAYDPDDIDEEDLDADHLQQVAETLADAHEGSHPSLDDCEPKNFRFDLCPACHRRYVEDPLGRDTLRRANYSKN
jgi:hypothetical protein